MVGAPSWLDLERDPGQDVVFDQVVEDHLGIEQQGVGPVLGPPLASAHVHDPLRRAGQVVLEDLLLILLGDLVGGLVADVGKHVPFAGLARPIPVGFGGAAFLFGQQVLEGQLDGGDGRRSISVFTFSINPFTS